jgi:hypothetical protein
MTLRILKKRFGSFSKLRESLKPAKEKDRDAD